MEDSNHVEPLMQDLEVARFYDHVEQFSKMNMLMALILTLNMWSWADRKFVCVRLFKQVFDVGGWYESLEITDTLHNLADMDFYYTMLIVDVFIYKMFRRVPRLLEIMERAGHHLSMYAYCICMMMNPDTDSAKQGLNRFKGLVGTGDRIMMLERWRSEFCKDIYKRIDGLFPTSYCYGVICQVHHRVTRFGERNIICYECWADFEMRTYHRHFDFHMAIEDV